MRSFNRFVAMLLCVLLAASSLTACSDVLGNALRDSFDTTAPAVSREPVTTIATTDGVTPTTTTAASTTSAATQAQQSATAGVTTAPSPQETTGVAVQTTAATTKETVAGTAPKPQDPVTPNQTFRFSYSLTESKVSAFSELLSVFEGMILEERGTTEEVAQAAQTVTDAYYEIYTQSQLAYLEYCAYNTEEARDHYLYASEASGDAYSAYMQTCRRIDESDSVYRDLFFENWTGEQLEDLRSDSSDDMEYSTKNRELLVEYRSLSAEDFENGASRLFAELVDMNNEKAVSEGYDDYMSYAYENVYYRDYTPEDVAIMREYVKSVVVPLCKQAYHDFYEAYGALTAEQQGQMIEIVQGDYLSLEKDYLTPYLNRLPMDMADGMFSLFEGNNAFFAKSDSAKGSAFTGYLIAYDTPYCYFGPEHQNLFTVLHELGHYYNFLCTKNTDIVMDLAEIHSQGNELLFAAYLLAEANLTPVEQAAITYQTFDALLSIITCTMVDEFEQTVYEGIDSITDPVTQLDPIMTQIVARYAPDGFLTSVLDMNHYWRLVVIESPAYYISYAMSGIVSFELYAMAKENYDEAIRVYCDLVEEADTDVKFLEKLEQVGLNGPFDQELYELLLDLYA